MIFLKIVLSLVLTLISLLILAVLVLALSSLFVDTSKLYEKNSRYYRFLLAFSTMVGMKVMRIKIHVTGIENIPSDGKFLLVGNHRSNFDPLIAWHILRKKNLTYISKASNLKIPVFGRIVRRCCFMDIDRENPMNAMRTIRHAIKLTKSTHDLNIAVYPEGTRSKTGELLPFHDGVFLIAQKAECPIVTVAMSGTENIHKNFPKKKSDVYVDFSPAMPVDKVTSVSCAEIGESVRAFLEEKLGEKTENQK